MILNGGIEYAILDSSANRDTIKTVSEKAASEKASALCVAPYYIKAAVQALKESDVLPSTLIAYPNSFASTPAKVEDIKRATNEGSAEMDIALNVQAIKANDWSYVQNDIDSCITATRLKGKKSKLLIKVKRYTDEEFTQVGKIISQLEPDYVKLEIESNVSDFLSDWKTWKKHFKSGIKIILQTTSAPFSDAEYQELKKAGINRVCYVI